MSVPLRLLLSSISAVAEGNTGDFVGIAAGEGMAVGIVTVGVASAPDVGTAIGSRGIAVEVGGIESRAGIGVFTEVGDGGRVAVAVAADGSSGASSEQAMTDAQMSKHSKSAELEIGRLSDFKLDSQEGKCHQASYPIARGSV